MFKRFGASTVLRAALVLLGFVLAPGALVAQSAAEYRVRAMRALPAYRDGIRTQEIAESLARLADLPDTLRVGHLVVLSQRSVAEPVRQSMRSAWPVIEERFGEATLALARRPIQVWTPDSGRSFNAGQVAVPGSSVSSQTLGESPDAIATGLVRFASLTIWNQTDSTLRSWLPAPLELSVDFAKQREWTYYELVTSPTTVTRSCFVGDLSSCEAALGLIPVADSLLVWYDAAGRRALVARFKHILDQPPLQLAYYSCTADGSDSACWEILRAARDSAFIRKSNLNGGQDLMGGLPAPAGPAARSTLLAEVMQIGGRGAWNRLVESAGQPLSARLAIAGGVSMDSLVASWRARILQARPVPVSLPERTAWASVAWIAVLGVLGMQSSRWR